MFFKKKCITIIAILLCVFTLSFSYISENGIKNTSSNIIYAPKIIIDAGHDGFN